MSSDGIVGDIRSICGMPNDAVGTLSGLFKSGASLVCFVGARCPRQAAKYPSCRYQVGQPQQQHQPLRVLNQPSVPDLSVAKVPLHVQERMLHLRPDRRFALLQKCLMTSRIQLPTPPGPHRYLPLPLPTPDSPPAYRRPDTLHHPTPVSLHRAVDGAPPSRHAHSQVS